MIFFTMIIVGMVFALLLAFVNSVNRSANRFLALALATMILWMVRVLTIDIQPSSILPFQFLLALGPLLYFYVRKITRPKPQFKWKDLVHFTPLLLEQVLLHFQQLSQLLQLLVFISMMAYLYLCNRLIERFYGGLPLVLMDRSRLEFRWLRRLLATTALLWCLWIAYAVLGGHDYYPFYIFFVVIMIWTAAAAFLKPQAAAIAQAAAPYKPPLPAELRAKGTLIKRAIETNLYYQEPELSLGSLAEKLRMPPHELSRVINVVFKKSFNDFINEYRVLAAALKMQDPAYYNMTLLGIAFEAGFNSQRTFNRVFKEMTGKTPAEYKNDLKKEWPIDKLASSSKLRPVILRPGSLPIWAPDKTNRRYMFSNYLKISLWNLSRNKGYAFINVTGLAVGIAASLLIFLVIQYETSFDDFHAHKERIYRIATRFNRADGVGYTRGTCFPAGKQLRLDYPELENVTSISGEQGGQLTVVDGKGRPTQKKFKEDGLYLAEPQFFAIFNFPFLAGDPKTALAAPNTVVLTQQAAEKYFGDWHTAMGRSLEYDGNKLCKVTGVLQNFPANTDFPVQVAISFKTLADDTSRDWVSTSGDLNTYVVLPPGLAADKFSKSLVSFGKKHIPAEYAGRQALVLQPLATVHSDKRFGNYNRSTFSQELVTALGVIGLFLLVIACINFVNLATAQAVNRAKEVGVRKVLGGRKPQLVAQFLCESFIITLAAAVIAVIIAFGVLPMLNGLLHTNINLHFNGIAALFLPAVVVMVTLLSGLYPVVVLSGFNPITALKSRLAGNSPRGISLRRVLVVFQFTVAQALIIGTLVVVSQMDYFRNAPMGFDKEAIVNVPVPNDSVSRSKYNALKHQLLELPGVKNVSFGTFSISDNSHWGSDFIFDHATRVTNFNADLKWADADVFKTYGLQMAAGSPYRPSDTVREFVVNETMAKMLGLRNPQDIIGKQLSFWDGQLKGPVVGVVKDFNSASMAKPMSAVVMSAWKDVYQNIAIKLQPQQARPTLASIAGLWEAAYPEKVFEYQFLDEKIASFYKQEDQLSTLYKLFAGIAVFISCLGLYGLVSFMAVQRTREIGIRKVLGASSTHIVYLFSKEFTPLIAIAFLIAAPLAYYFMYAWLQSFSFRISIGIGLFFITIIASTAIAWLTAGYRALKAALANPVKGLRNE